MIEGTEHLFHKWTGFFLDPNLEEHFLLFRQNNRRPILFLYMLVLFIAYVIDIPRNILTGHPDNRAIAIFRNFAFLAICVFFLVACCWFPFPFKYFEKAVGVGIVLWTLVTTWMSDNFIEILLGRIYFNESFLAQVLLTNTLVFVVMMGLFAAAVVIMPLRRPTLVVTLAVSYFLGVCHPISLATYSDDSRLNIFCVSAVLGAGIVLCSVVVSLTNEETAPGAPPLNPAVLAVMTRRLIKELNEATTLASNAEHLLDINLPLALRQMSVMAADEAVRDRDGDGKAPGGKGGKSGRESMAVHRGSLFSVVSSGEGAESDSDEKMMQFLSANFVRQRQQEGVVRPRREVVSSPSEGAGGEVCGKAGRLIRQAATRAEIDAAVDVILKPFEAHLPMSLSAERKCREFSRNLPPSLSSSSNDGTAKGERPSADLPGMEWGLDLTVLEGQEIVLQYDQTKGLAGQSPESPARLEDPHKNPPEDLHVGGALPLVGLSLLRPFILDPLGQTGLYRVLNFLLMVGRSSDLAMNYNDKSVLENFHASKTFHIMRKPGCNILVCHFEFVTAMKLRRKDPDFALSLCGETGGGSPSSSEKKVEVMEQDVWMVTMACLKAADLGHSTKPWAVHFARSLAVTEEFFQQGDQEKALALPISPLCGREGSSAAGLCKSQIGFLNFVCRELYVELSQVERLSKAPRAVSASESPQENSAEQVEREAQTETADVGGTVLSVCLANLDRNVENWKLPETALQVPSELFEPPPAEAVVIQEQPVSPWQGKIRTTRRQEASEQPRQLLSLCASPRQPPSSSMTKETKEKSFLLLAEEEKKATQLDGRARGETVTERFRIPRGDDEMPPSCSREASLSDRDLEA
uniref:PDEase domain-containing protein n=1 Tax=Chromera velia CCMP2878 TaxID=1169474 RepID=A0A0G4FIS0_9ALVE|eukprot:Cvel_3378.t1-p1 / transcript=Cvel_3378.t1 / gene=Cvel_3378 / organism=Chromera_velia_CCMP2878 / gene_product=Calcium/calmodulin-dependent 3',5'-cyclic, putative / transcript_product=Calcium/calmodulin-dependent 3',5'-cyclic, putative / location=Cvel_scaffold136:9955-17038(+) / protein_length=862 / sequence_SO=supercontig / SO=protein_coding / is_pseudo=false